MTTTLYVASLNGRTLHAFADCRHLNGKDVETRTLRGTCSDGTMTHGMNYCAACDKRTDFARAAVEAVEAAEDVAYVEVWWNRNTRDWVVECKSIEGYPHWRGSDYVSTLKSALTIAAYQSEKYGNCPIRRTTSTGDAYKGRATAVRK